MGWWNVTEDDVLEDLARYPDSSAGEIAERVGEDAGKVGALLAMLEDARRIERRGTRARPRWSRADRLARDDDDSRRAFDSMMRGNRGVL